MKRGVSVLLLMLLVLALSSVHPTSAVPSSRSLRSIIETVSNQLVYDEFQTKGRMDMEIQDYSGTGANNHHDPIPPGGF